VGAGVVEPESLLLQEIAAKARTKRTGRAVIG
jgi:hypothetical protein